MLREPKIEAPKPEGLKQKNSTAWHTMQCQLVTPLYGGGVQSHVVDEDMPIRISGIRGQLRFWWRLLANHKWGLSDSDSAIRQQEFLLWGGSDDDKNPQASLVFLKISDTEVLSKYAKNNCVDHNSYYMSNQRNRQLPYVFFAADNETDSSIKHEVLKEGLAFELAFKFAQNTTQTQQSQVIETLRWWANFGGVGARTRRGLGSVQVTQCEDFTEITTPLTADDVAQAGCQLAIRHSNNKDVIDCWRDAVKQLKDFRQGADIGRNANFGRSRWPEPDAIRRLVPCHNPNPNHAPEHKAGNIFPRAMFGLPIIFHFVGGGEPQDVTLTLADAERMSSPVILRAYYNGKNWSSAALLLPYQAPEDMQLNRVGRQQAQVWRENAAQDIRPIKDNGGGNPLQAFMQFFAK